MLQDLHNTISMAAALVLAYVLIVSLTAFVAERAIDPQQRLINAMAEYDVSP